MNNLFFITQQILEISEKGNGSQSLFSKRIKNSTFFSSEFGARVILSGLRAFKSH